MGHAVTCMRCKRPIGVYEPTVMVNDEGAWHTSRAVQRGLGINDERLLHLDCYEALEVDTAEAPDASS